MKKIILTIIFCLFSITACFGLEAIRFNSYIADNANVISKQDATDINNIIKELSDKTRIEILVVTLNSLQGQSVGGAARQIGDTYDSWKRGTRGGIILLVVPSEKKVSIQPSRSLGSSTDRNYTSRQMDRVIDNMIPQFRSNDYSTGIRRGVNDLAILMAQRYGVDLDSTDYVSTSGNSSMRIFPTLLPFAIIIICIINVFLRSKRRKYGQITERSFRDRFFDDSDEIDRRRRRFNPNGRNFDGEGGSSREW